MRLTQFSDHALRVLMYAAAHDDRLITIEEVARAYRVSRAHLMKVANCLTRAGFLVAVRGRSGGLRLARSAAEIRVGEVLRATEPDFALAECFSPDDRCVISTSCRLRGILREGLAAFATALDRYTLADLALRPAAIRALSAG